MFENLKNIKDYWVDTAIKNLEPDADLIASDCENEYKLIANKLTSKTELLAFRKVQNEIIEGVIHSLCVMIDGGDELADNLLIDIIDRETNQSLQENIALHEEFIGYLLDVEEE
ncbi:histidine kinase [Neobacillus sp. LXY-1]|uniref:histidine kinase n=1 Tax=Neobacillus sp. LXY-1 TaxID=3379133 RepID=UPI003EDF26C9